MLTQVWNLKTQECVETWKKIHHKTTLLRAPFDRSFDISYGVTKIEIDENYIYSTGADGTVKRKQKLG